jgi:hypothetical protein
VEHSTLGSGGVGLGETLPATAVGLELDDATLLVAADDADTSGRTATVVVPQPVAAITTSAAKAILLIGIA